MAQLTSRIVTPSDADIISGFITIWEDMDQPDATQYSLAIGDKQPLTLQGKAEELAHDKQIAALRSGASTLIGNATLNLTKVSTRVQILRREGHTDLTINFPDDPSTIARLAAVRSAFHKFDGLPFLEGTIGPELAQFYEKREQALVRLEALAEDLIRRTDEYRAELDSKLESRRTALEEQFDADRGKLARAYDERQEKLDAREEELQERIGELDDRSNTHARRKLREDLKAILEQRNTAFALTQGTQRKRWPIHVLFILLILVFGGFTTDLVIDQFSTTQSADWPGLLRTSLALISFGASLAFYIRWSDRWATQHAEEEFRLRQLELDVDRASWVVEMALEWKEARGAQIPDQLVQSLTRGLFERESPVTEVRHPSEDLASALLAASAGLTLKIPGFGDLVLDRRGVRRFERALREDAGSGD